MNDPALGISHHLELDVAGVDEVFFEIQRRVAKGTLGLVPGRIVGVLQLLPVPGEAHAAAAAAGRRLENDRVPDLLRQIERFTARLERAIGAGQDGHLGSCHGFTGLRLVAHEPDRFG